MPGEDGGVQLGGDGRPRVPRDGDQAPRAAVAEHVDRAAVAQVGDGHAGHGVERLLDLQRGEQAGRVGEKQRAAQQALPLGDVAEAPDPADDRVADPLRARVALEDPPVAAAHDVDALRLGVRVALLDVAEELVGILDLVARVGEERLLVAAVLELGRDPPQAREPTVVDHHPAIAIDDQDPVGGRLDGGLQQREQPLAGLGGLGELGDVPAGADQPDGVAVGVREDLAPRVEHPDASRPRERCDGRS